MFYWELPTSLACISTIYLKGYCGSFLRGKTYSLALLSHVTRCRWPLLSRILEDLHRKHFMKLNLVGLSILTIFLIVLHKKQEFCDKRTLEWLFIWWFWMDNVCAQEAQKQFCFSSIFWRDEKSLRAVRWLCIANTFSWKAMHDGWQHSCKLETHICMTSFFCWLLKSHRKKDLCSGQAQSSIFILWKAWSIFYSCFLYHREILRMVILKDSIPIQLVTDLKSQGDNLEPLCLSSPKEFSLIYGWTLTSPFF